MPTTIALAGNPNSGKTTLFNILTGANQFVGNWPGVTVEKKEGKLRKHSDVKIADLPGIYSLSPYSPEEIVARRFLTNEKPQAIINIVDGTNIERNLFLTTQLMELEIPMVIAINMMDEVDKLGDKIDEEKLSKLFNCKVVGISALKNKGIDKLVEAALEAAQKGNKPKPVALSTRIENAIEEVNKLSPNLTRWHAIKMLERDFEATKDLNLAKSSYEKAEEIIKELEEKADDEVSGMLSSDRYEGIASLLKNSYVKKNRNKLSKSDRIDRIVTNRFLALPIFVLIMGLVYYIAVSTIGTAATDFTNDGIFGDGFFFLGKGRVAYDTASEEYANAQTRVLAFEEAALEKGIELLEGEEDKFNELAKDISATAIYEDEDGKETGRDEVNLALYKTSKLAEEPEAKDFGPWVRGVPVIVDEWLTGLEIAPWLHSLIVEGIIAGVGAVLGFVPQIFVLFLMLSLLESIGYMARIAFIMDRIFRRFGLSGKAFIPVMIGTGCSIPGIMASRTIENIRDRRMTIITTSFMPCSAKLPVIAMIAGALFNQSGWVSTFAYFLGISAIITSGIILKKTKRFAGDPAPFVMELPSYRFPRISNVLRSTWERGWSFVKKAGSVILLSSIFVWFISKYGIIDGKFAEVGEDLVGSFAQTIGGLFSWIFKPLGFGEWRNSVATVMGLVAKENVVATFGILYGMGEVSEAGREIWVTLAANFSSIAALSFLTFNLLCAPCFAAIGAIKREMNNGKWTMFAVLYQTALAFVVSLIMYQLGGLIMGLVSFNVFTVVAVLALLSFIYMLFRTEPNIRKADR